MTNSERESVLYTLYCNAEESMKSIQQYATSLKNPEDSVKNMVTLLKIQDSIADMRKTYEEVDRLMNEETEEESDYDNGTGYTDDYTQNLLNPLGL